MIRTATALTRACVGLQNAHAMNVMGDKAGARKAMREAGVPVVPGFDDIADAEQAEAAAREIGFPVMLKASAGGGGKGMRIVHEASELRRAYEGAVIAERVERLRERLRQALDPEDAGVAVLDPTVVRFARASTSVAALTPVRALSAAAEDRGEHALTPREHEILALLATGATNLQIADQLVLSESTVKSHVKRILRKLPAANRAEAAYRYLRTATPAGATT